MKSTTRPGFAGLRNAFHLALGILPLILLLPQALVKKYVNKKMLILVGVMNTAFRGGLRFCDPDRYRTGKSEVTAPVRCREAGLAHVIPDGRRL